MSLTLSTTSLLALSAVLVPDVLELQDGSRLVGELRSRGRTIALATPYGELHFDTEEASRLVRRNDLLPLYRTTLHGVNPDEPHGFASLAYWCLDHGLFPEAFDATDRALEASLDESASAALLARLEAESLLDGCSSQLVVPGAARDRLLGRVAGKSASRGQWARTLLTRGEAQERRSWLLGRLAADSDDSVRAGAVKLLEEFSDDGVLSRLIRASLIDPDATVRALATDAVVRASHPERIVPYLRALEVEDSTFRMRVLPALIRLRDPRAIPALIARLEPRPAAGGGANGAVPRAHVNFGEQCSYVQDFDVEIAQGAVIAKPVIGVLQKGVVLDVGVAGVFTIRTEERRAILGALRSLAGHDAGSDASTWRAWWSGQAGKLRAAPETIAAR